MIFIGFKKVRKMLKKTERKLRKEKQTINLRGALRTFLESGFYVEVEKLKLFKLKFVLTMFVSR